MKIKRFRIVGINGIFRVIAIGMDESVNIRRFRSIDRCFKWLKQIEKHNNEELNNAN